MTKANYTARISYDEDFVNDLNLFLQLIKVDKSITEKYPNRKNYFSLAVRGLIRYYNKKRLEERKAQLKNENNINTKGQ